MKSCMMLLGVTLRQIFKQMNIMWTKQVKPTDDYMFLNIFVKQPELALVAAP